ncbi:hypothetical protein KU306_17440 (plasmid) [Haloferax larsenii]|uniref:Uncharacterized protein n=1 Tax=Haloferax larsenii TaxID=302484 RepID=A0ABY5RN45_HALLR|nr:hypothetical protein [Haloferax larsenii]ELZ80443.1 hypothetical protein C455_06216 [Haloferax larsenii JCM 13917]UVE52398.1 hypothetical protein KU306_17440 [Haloferax larsenii]
MKGTDVADSVSGGWGGILYGLIFLTAFLADVFDTSINPLLAVIVGILLIFIPFTWKSYRETIEK